MISHINKHILWALGFGAVVVAGFFWWQAAYAPVVEVVDDRTPSIDQPDLEAAELTGFGFMQDLIKAAPGEDDEAARERLYAALSERAKAEVAIDTLMRDIAAFVGIQDVPEQGVSVENLEVYSDTETTLIVGLNYSSGRTLRAIDMVVERGEWKVDTITALETYPPEEGETRSVPTPVANGDKGRDAQVGANGCYVGGCSGQICSEDPDVISTCEWLEEYACYREATCEHQADGQCGWTQTDTLLECLATVGEG